MGKQLDSLSDDFKCIDCYAEEKKNFITASDYIHTRYTDGCSYLCSLVDGHLTGRKDSFSGCHEGALVLLASPWRWAT